MIVKLLTEHHLEFLSLKGGCRGLSESTLIKTSNCWKSHAAAHIHKSRNLPICRSPFYTCLKVYIHNKSRDLPICRSHFFCEVQLLVLFI